MPISKNSMEITSVSISKQCIEIAARAICKICFEREKKMTENTEHLPSREGNDY